MGGPGPVKARPTQSDLGSIEAGRPSGPILGRRGRRSAASGVLDILAASSGCSPRAAAALRPIPRGSNLDGQPSPRAGFSLIEAMVVLMIGGMALLLVFAIGGRAAQIGFGLGDRALSVADQQLAQDNLRALIGGLALPPAAMSAEDAGFGALSAGPDGFVGDAVLGRSTPCAARGPAHDLKVEIQAGRGGDQVVCQVGDGVKVKLFDLRPRHARFAYSPDGVRWSDRWSSPSAGAGGSVERKRPRSLYVMLATDDGAFEVVDRADSGRPSLYPLHAPASSGADAGL